MENEKVDHIEISDEEMKETVGGGRIDHVANMKECLRSYGVTEKEITFMSRRCFFNNYAYDGLQPVWRAFGQRAYSLSPIYHDCVYYAYTSAMRTKYR